jgi:hypothetical protein
MEHVCNKVDVINEMDKRLIRVETRQDNMEQDIKDIKASQKESRTLVMTTLITSLLTLVGIIFSFVRWYYEKEYT